MKRETVKVKGAKKLPINTSSPDLILIDRKTGKKTPIDLGIVDGPVDPLMSE